MGRKKLTTEEAKRMANLKWSKISKRKRKLHSIAMNRARWNKLKVK